MLKVSREMFVLTASYISNPERLAYLRLCAQSVRDVLPEATHVVSLCFAPGIDAESLADLPCHVILRSERMSQFEQIDLLLQEVEMKDNDFVMLLDDDDLLLTRPSPARVLKSTQALYRGREDQREWTHTEVLRRLEEEYRDEDWEFVRDLSGFGCRAGLLRGAPYRQAETFEHFGDLDFMSYINSLEEGLCYQRPYIFYRLHGGNGTNSDWAAGLIAEMQELMSMIQASGLPISEMESTLLLLPEGKVEELPLNEQSARIRAEEREVDRLSRALYKR